MQDNTEKNIRFRKDYDQYSRLIYSVAYSYMKNTSDANDAMQEAFLKYYQHMEHLESEEHIKPWLITVVSNICKNMLRSGWFTRTFFQEDCEEEPVSEEDFGERSELFWAVMKLPEKERVPVHLFYYEGYSAVEISKLLKINVSTVRVRLMRGRERLKSILKEEQV